MLYTPLLSFSSFLWVIVVISTLLLVYPCFSVGVFFIHFSYEGFQDSNQWGWIFFSGSKRGEAKRRFGFDCLPSFLLLDFCFFLFYFNLLVLAKKAGPALDLTQGIDGCLALSRAGLPYRRGFVSWRKCLISCFIRGNGGVYTIGFVIAG